MGNIWCLFEICGSDDIKKETLKEDVKYNEKYIKKFDSLSCSENIDRSHENNFILENSTHGNVFMSYNKEGNFFLYYADKKIPNHILEIVAQKFVVQFNCKSIYHLKSNQEEIEENQFEKLPDVYGKFKKKQLKERPIIESNINVYKYVGKICEFPLLKIPVKKKETKKISYKDFINK